MKLKEKLKLVKAYYDCKSLLDLFGTYELEQEISGNYTGTFFNFIQHMFDNIELLYKVTRKK